MGPRYSSVSCKLLNSVDKVSFIAVLEGGCSPPRFLIDVAFFNRISYLEVNRITWQTPGERSLARILEVNMLN